jgi:DNA polymerase III alpha subunit (gram-positive type)
VKENLLRFNKRQKFMVFDFETCGLNLASSQNKPWQLAFMIFQGDKKISEHDYFIKWNNLPISPEARKITNFNEKRYKKEGKEPLQVLEHFEKYLYDPSYIKLGHNILGFDIYMHNILRRLCGKSANYSYLNKSIDTLCLAKAIKKDIKKGKGEDFLFWQFKLTSFIERGMRNSIKALCKEYSILIDEKKLHDALYDIKINYEIFQRQLWQIEI